MLHFFSVTMD